MWDSFLEEIDKLYNKILEPIDIVHKIELINDCKFKLEILNKGTFAEQYCKLLGVNKENGVVYTPKEIAIFMIENLIKPQDIINNPYIKIADPSCGCGNLIIPSFYYLKRVFTENLDFINLKNNMGLKLQDINRHIVENNLFGFDIDENAIKVLMIDLFEISGYVNNKNFLVRDFLIDNIDNKFDFYIGNPPYIGHKSIDKSYSKLLKEKYRGIYKDKGDISYCFFEKSFENLINKGKLTFITSRYFCESPSGEELRKLLNHKTNIYKLVDFYGIRPFKNVGIDPIIIFLEKKQSKDNKIEVIRPYKTLAKEKSKFYNSLFLNEGENYKSFFVDQSSLNSSGWILVDEIEKGILSKIKKKSEFILSDICESYQGIITGCDKAFVVDNSILKDKKIELDIIKPWIKSSYISKNIITGENKFIIYSNLIKTEEQYPNAIDYIKEQKERLINRRECKKGIRKWYELQWGRKAEIFEGEKIIFPYKASSNRFALDKGSYFSADVYSLILKKNINFSYETLIFILNSTLYEFYFKTFAKKLGENLYEYYPNNLMKLSIPNVNLFEEDKKEKFLYDYFQLTDEEIKVVEKVI